MQPPSPVALEGGWNLVVKSDAFPSILELGPAPLWFSQRTNSKRRTRDQMDVHTHHLTLFVDLTSCRLLLSFTRWRGCMVNLEQLLAITMSATSPPCSFICPVFSRQRECPGTSVDTICHIWELRSSIVSPRRHGGQRQRTLTLQKILSSSGSWRFITLASLSISPCYHRVVNHLFVLLFLMFAAS